MSVSQLAERLDEPISSLHRLLQALVQERVISQDRRDKRYSLSVDLLELSHVLVRDPRLRQVAHPYLTKNVEETNATAFLSAWVQDRAIAVDAVETPHSSSPPLSVQSYVIAPFHCAASGKAILAYQPPERIDELLRDYCFERWTERTITDAHTLCAHLGVVRQQGYAVCDEEAQAGVTAIACPIFANSGEVRASVGLCAESPRFQQQGWDRELAILRQIAERISVEWGGYRRFVLT
jgi:DNA-binding IclR family transcriptional regulator